MKMFRKILAIGMVIGLASYSTTIFAAANTNLNKTPANTLLTNSAKLTYFGNTEGITRSVSVKVELVAAPVAIAETFSEPNDSVNKADNQAYSATYVVQSTANGPDTYTITTSYFSQGSVSGAVAPTVTDDDETTVTSSTIQLGATASSDSFATTTTAITVPSDGNANTNLNGIEDGEFVIIDGNKYTVSTVVDNANGTSTINLTTGLQTAISAGEGIFEYITFSSDVSDVGTATGGTDVLVVRVNVESVADTDQDYTDDVSITLVAVTFTKYVRNATTNTCVGTCTVTTYDSGSGSNNYYIADVTAKPGETLEYYLKIQTSDAGLTTAVIGDTLADFTSYVASTTILNEQAVSDGADAGTAQADPIFTLDATDTTDGGLKIDDVTTARPGGAGSQGTGVVGTNKTVNVVYKVLVAP